MQIKLLLKSIAKAIFIYPFVSIAALLATMLTFGIILGAVLYSVPLRYQDSIIFLVVWIVFSIIVCAFYMFEGEADMQNYRFSVLRHVISLFVVNAALLIPIVRRFSIEHIPDAVLGVFYAPFMWLVNSEIFDNPALPVIINIILNMGIFTGAYLLGKFKYVKIRPHYNKFTKTSK